MIKLQGREVYRGLEKVRFWLGGGKNMPDKRNKDSCKIRVRCY